MYRRAYLFICIKAGDPQTPPGGWQAWPFSNAHLVMRHFPSLINAHPFLVCSTVFIFCFKIFLLVMPIKGFFLVVIFLLGTGMSYKQNLTCVVNIS